MRLRSLLSQVRFTQRIPFLLGEYVYQPLPTKTSIRLLELKPSTDKGRIRCSLRTFELEDAPTFKALSYTWGHSDTTISRSSTIKEDKAQSVSHHRTTVPENDAEITGRRRLHHIICDDRLMKVTSNLRDALHMLGNAVNMPLMPKIPTYYWIDALCMDQSNILERNSQVARMAAIFQKASGVIVWLGQEDDYTADALQVLRKVSEIPESDWPCVQYTSFYDPNAVEQLSRPDLTYYNWLGFIALVNRPWFRRAWVSQNEIDLTTTLTQLLGRARDHTW